MACRFVSLSFPQMVVVENSRLTCVYYAIWLACLGSYVKFFWSFDMWAVRADMADHIFPSLTIESHASRTDPPDLCSGQRNFNYRAAGRYYTDSVCWRACREGETLHTGCVPVRDRSWSEGKTQVFLASHIKEDATLASAGMTPGQSIFAPSVEDHAVRLAYSYHAPGGRDLIFQGATEVRSSDANVITVLLDKNGREMQVIPAGSAIVVPVTQLLDMADMAGELDAPQAGFPANQAGADAPIGRITGLSLELMLNCYDEGGDSVSKLKQHTSCYLRARKAWRDWISSAKERYMPDGSTRFRDYRGLRVHLRTGGYAKVFSTAQTLKAAAVGLVLMQLPAKFVLFFAVMCLGRLSSIYNDAIFRTFSLSSQVAGLSARLLACASAFEPVHASQGLTPEALKGRFLQRIWTATESPAPGVEAAVPSPEMQSFLTYSWRLMARGEAQPEEEPGDDDAFRRVKESVRAFFSQLCSRQKPSRRSAIADEVDVRGRIEAEDFARAFSSTEPVAMKTWLSFFGHQRRRGCLEQFFVPMDIRTELLESAVEEALPFGGIHFEPKEIAGAEIPGEVGASLSTKGECVKTMSTVRAVRSALRPSYRERTAMKVGLEQIRERLDEVGETHERLNEVQQRLEGLAMMRTSVESVFKRCEQLDEDVDRLVKRCDELAAKIDKRFTIIKERLQFHVGSLDATGEVSPQNRGRLGEVELDLKTQKAEIEAVRTTTERMKASMEVMERRVSFLSAPPTGGTLSAPSTPASLAEGSAPATVELGRTGSAVEPWIPEAEPSANFVPPKTWGFALSRASLSQRGAATFGRPGSTLL
mmetsp:Transcript_53086/g.166775  ORF Transcript_53086/g.166775 Transcript_53086/m.166775 type:complete len:818 (-) Transcript_53086:45-2498(-)